MNSFSSLASVPLRQLCRIAKIVHQADRDLSHSLMEHGCLPGTPVQVLHRARGILVLQVRGTRLMMHQAAADLICLSDALASPV
jgi:Fe2+ transport system protein FeoA